MKRSVYLCCSALIILTGAILSQSVARQELHANSKFLYKLLIRNRLWYIKTEVLRLPPPWGSTPKKVNTNLREIDVTPDDKTFIFVTYGQSNAANSITPPPGRLSREYKDVYLTHGNKTYDYRDPWVGGKTAGWSHWGDLGERLIRLGKANKVIFANAGWGGRCIEELSIPPFSDRFREKLMDLYRRYGRVDGVLFQQGECNNNFSITYKDAFRRFLDLTIINGRRIPTYMSISTLCGIQLPPDPVLQSIQNELIANYQFVLRGPNTDLLGKSFRDETGCHFSIYGAKVLAEKWSDAILTSSER